MSRMDDRAKARRGTLKNGFRKESGSISGKKETKI